ncbi:hypothetical protein DQ384_36460 [Sphaerisporangium album]|uniref:Uncharacterized protein n=1 Tax=Sphaerisporangium album TaxID=509200 RepID=A0A367EWJ3_9ACTN|nr:hypothetical protein [Sphaerisporangium album]RCG21955.1 hypothetical protein DQ384_36460 [Sphaerisporangium album]
MIKTTDKKIKVLAVRATALLVPVAGTMLILVPDLINVLRVLGALASLLVAFYVLSRPDTPPPRPSWAAYRDAFFAAFPVARRRNCRRGRR